MIKVKRNIYLQFFFLLYGTVIFFQEYANAYHIFIEGTIYVQDHTPQANKRGRETYC